jgi:ABC-type nitrate/sulfonate/bicarbonate transport system substrate-binding protein
VKVAWPSRAGRNFRRLAQAALFAFALSQTVAPAPAEETKKIRMAYSALSVAFLNIFVARDAGLFNKHGLDVELIQMAGPLPIAALSAGEIDYLTGYTTGLVAAGQGAPLKGLLVTMKKPPFYIVSEPGVQKLDDLAGKRFAVDRIGSLQHLVARVFFKTKGMNPERIIFTQTGSVSNTVMSLGQGAVSAALLSAPYNVVMVQRGFRQMGSADELPVNFPTSGLVVHEGKIKSDANQIKTVIRVMLDSMTYSRREKGWMINYVKDKWKLDTKVAETVYEQWLSTLAPDGKVNLKELQDYFDLAYSFKQIPAPVHVPAVTDYTLVDQVLAGK